MIKKKMLFYQPSDISHQTSAIRHQPKAKKLKTESSQRGFAPILVLLLLVAGIGLGAYLIQQQTNLSPRAEYTSADGGECKDNPRLAPPPDKKFMSEADRENYDYYWKADCSRTCVDFNNSTDCPASDLGGDKTRWCYGFKDAGYCLRLQVVKTGTSEDVSNTDQFKESTGKKPTQVSAGGGSGGSSGGNINACTTAETQQIANTYYDAKVAQRYARYTAIMNGATEYCVQADLGVEGLVQLRQTSSDGTNGRLYLCSGKSNTKGGTDLVWKVVSDDGKIHPAATSGSVSVDQANRTMADYISAAKQKLSIE